MADRSIQLYRDNKGNLEKIEKVIGNKVMVFRFSDKENKVVSNTFSLKDRLYSSDDLWVPKVQYVAAYRQAIAIFKKNPQKKSSHHQRNSPSLS